MTDRTGLYIMTLIAMVAAVKSCERTERISSRMNDKPDIHTMNLIGDERPERFFYSNGHRCYLEIDGQPIESYIASKSLENLTKQQ